MTEPVITQLIIDASGAKGGAAEFEAAMARAKAAAIDGGNATASSFEKAQARWTASLAATDPVIKAQIAMERELAKQRAAGSDAVRLGIATQDAAAAQLDRVRQKHEALIQTLKTGEFAQTAFGRATSGVSGQLIGLSAGAGPVGVFLSSLGPWGLVAAAGLGAVGAALNYVSEESERMGQKSIEVERFSRVTGLAASEIGSLKRAGASFGITGDEITSSFQRLTVNLTDARRASGDLFDQTQLLGGGLADELRNADTEQKGIMALAKAYHFAADEGQRAAIAKAAFGKAGVGQGPVLETIFNAGGIENLSNKTKELNDATSAQTKRWAEMQAQIDILNKSAKNIMASIFTEDGLNKALAVAQYMERIARSAKEAAQQREGLSFFQNLAVTLAKTSDVGQSDEGSKILEETTNKFAALQRIAKGLGSNLAVDQKSIDSWVQLGDALRGVLTPAEQTKKTLKDAQDAAAADTKLYSERISVLGSAASIEEKRIARELQLKSVLADNKVSQTDFNRAVAANNLDAYTASLNATVSALGAAASTTQQVQARMAALQKARQDGADISDTDIANQKRIATETANGTAALLQQTDAQRIQAATVGLSVGAAAALSAKLQLLANDMRAGKVATEEDTAARKAATDALGAQAQAAAQASATNKANFDLATAGLSGVEKQIADVQYQLHGDGWQKFMGDGLSATMRLTEQIREMKAATDGFSQSLLSGIMSGQGVGKSLLGAGTQMTSQLAQNTLKRVQSGGNLLGNQELGSMAGGLGIASAGLAGYQSGSPLGGALGGAMAGASFGPVGMAVGGIVGLIGGIFGKADKAKKELEEAQQAWAKMQGEVNKFTDQLNGKNTGSLGQSIADATIKAQQYADAANKAHASTAGLRDALVNFSQRVTRDFVVSFDVMAEAMDQGLGANSPAVKSQQNVKQIGDSLKAFIDDTVHAGQGLAQAQPAIDKAYASTQAYALSLLQVQEPLTEVQSALLTMRGSAQQLRTTLQDLGMSADDAAKAIAVGIGAALDSLRTKFASTIQRQINDASGKGYVNTTDDLIKSSVSSLNDAASLGSDPKQVALSFQLQAQQIVDGAGLIGNSFDEFIKQFPALDGVVHVSKAALKDLTDAQAAAQDAQREAQKTYYEALRSDQEAALSAQAAAQKGFDDALRSDQTAAISAQTAAQQRLTTAQQTAVKAVNDLSTATQNFYSQLRDTLAKYLHDLNIGAGASPQDRLATAQADYQKQLSLAQSGDRTALGSITEYSNDLLAAAKDYFASSAGYQSILEQVKNELSVLPEVAQLADPVVEQLKKANAFLVTNNALLGTGNTIGKTGNDIADAEKELIDAQNDLVTANNSLAVANNALTTNGLSLTTNTNSTLDAQNSLVNANNALTAANNALTSNGLSLTTNTNATLAAQNAMVDANNALTVANNNLSAAGNSTATNAAASLAALQSLQAATKQASIDISQSVVRLGQQQDATASGESSNYFGPMTTLLNSIEQHTAALANQGSSGPGGADAWYEDWFSQGGIVGRHAVGGIVGAYAPGGIVGNGIWNQDSVLASYAGGRGKIALAGGEGIINAAATSMIGPSAIDLMNRTGQLPRAGANDNGEHFEQLAKTLVRAMAATTTADIAAMREENALLRAEVRGLRSDLKSSRGEHRSKRVA